MRTRCRGSSFALDQGAAVPADSRAFAGIGMMGGPMAAYDALPWIAPLTALLRDAVGRDVPVIGHCLGGQLLAQALGARVARAPGPEIGWFDVDVDAAAAAREWFGGRDRFTTFQWHYDGVRAADGARRVLTNAAHANQAYVVDDRHIGMQCHVEMTRGAGRDPGSAPTPASCAQARGASVQPAAAIRAAAAVQLPALNAVAAAVYAPLGAGPAPVTAAR